MCEIIFVEFECVSALLLAFQLWSCHLDVWYNLYEIKTCNFLFNFSRVHRDWPIRCIWSTTARHYSLVKLLGNYVQLVAQVRLFPTMNTLFSAIFTCNFRNIESRYSKTNGPFRSYNCMEIYHTAIHQVMQLGISHRKAQAEWWWQPLISPVWRCRFKPRNE